MPSAVRKECEGARFFSTILVGLRVSALKCLRYLTTKAPRQQEEEDGTRDQTLPISIGVFAADLSFFISLPGSDALPWT